MRFANVSDLEARMGRTLGSNEAAQAAQLLEDASALIASQVAIDETDEDYAELLRITVCNMVRRAVSVEDLGIYGVTQSSITAGPYSQQQTFSNPTGELYLTKMEKRALGISPGYIGSIPAKVGWR